MTVTSPGHAIPGSPGRAARPAQLPRLLPHGGGVTGLPAHLARHGALPYRGAAGLLISEVADAGLTGRGGAAFPVARKLAAVAAGRRPVVVANGAESEPLSGKDASLLHSSPHLVLDGLQLAAEAVGARRAILYVPARLSAGGWLGTVLAQRAAAGLDRTEVELAQTPPGFLSGQETALVDAINGGPGRPVFTPPRIFERGVAGRPTLVQNAETLAHLALIARFGPTWFRGAGTAAEPGSMLATRWQADGRRGVVEAELGTPLRNLIAFGGHSRALLVGGYHGTWLPASQAEHLTLSNASLRPAGASVGAGVIAALPAGCCGLAETARVVRYLALESAGQCGPCLNGLPRIAAALAELAASRPGPRVISDLERWAGLVSGRGACHHPDGTVRFVRSALTVFAPEIAAHSAGHCTAMTSRPFLPVPAGGPARGGAQR
ncbi:MAG: NADH-ubiquinone oxidoreductase-F iron-sulfur binding region domain-containing protein [Actinomycetota bacterium]